MDYKKAMLIFYEQNNLYAFKQIFIDQFEFAVKEYFWRIDDKIALTYGTIYRSSLIRRASGEFLACLVPDMNPTASIIDIRYLPLLGIGRWPHQECD